jgi:signal transduction histidine kinase
VARRRGKTLSARFGWRAFWFSFLVLGLVTLGTGLFWRARLLDTIRDGLTAHIRSVESELQLVAPNGLDPFPVDGLVVLPAPETGIQIVTLGGDVLASSPRLAGAAPLVPVDELPAAAGVLVTRNVTTAGLGHSMVMAATIEVSDHMYAVEAVVSLAEADQACWMTCLVLPGVAGLVAALIGIGVAISIGYALRPVRVLTRRAAEVAGRRKPSPLKVTASTAELQELATQLDLLLEAIRASFEREQTFLDDASHELRTPIAIARAELDLAKRSRPDPNTAAALDSALEEIERLDQAAGDLLVLARARAAGPDGFRPIEVAPIARRAVTNVQRAPDARDIEITVAGGGVVDGDPNALERALTNLVANAARYCHSYVDVTAAASGLDVTITVADDGPGIPDHLLDSLFDRFSRGSDRQAHSTGLGTAIAAEVVAVHGGTISAGNRLHGGAEITITLPATAGPFPLREGTDIAPDRRRD